MDLKSGFSTLEKIFDILTALMPSIDSKLLVCLAGILLGYLETIGYADPKDHAQNLIMLEQLLGTAITMVTILSYFIHDAVTAKNPKVQTQPSGFAQFIKGLVFKQSIQPSLQSDPTVPENIPQ